jgi:hypothetical protein
MGKTFSRLLITSTALGIALLRIYRPDVQVDATVLILVGIAISPWMTSLGLKPKVKADSTGKGGMGTGIFGGKAFSPGRCPCDCCPLQFPSCHRNYRDRMELL